MRAESDSRSRCRRFVVRDRAYLVPVIRKSPEPPGHEGRDHHGREEGEGFAKRTFAVHSVGRLTADGYGCQVARGQARCGTHSRYRRQRKRSGERREGKLEDRGHETDSASARAFKSPSGNPGGAAVTNSMLARGSAIAPAGKREENPCMEQARALNREFNRGRCAPIIRFTNLTL